MQKFVEKLIGTFKCEELRTELIAVGDVISIVNQLAEEYKKEPFAIYETIRSNRLDCEVPSDCFEQIKEVRIIDEWTEETKVFNQESTQKNQEWILCGERLPEENERVLCMTKRKRMETAIYRYGGFWACGSEWLKNVIAWQPLPAPYRPKGDN